ncbi:ATP-binding protein [Allopontixanthobacter confluentis]|nr:ATP-binding protein [Allopontixanthobacter confluentis]
MISKFLLGDHHAGAAQLRVNVSRLLLAALFFAVGNWLSFKLFSYDGRLAAIFGVNAIIIGVCCNHIDRRTVWLVVSCFAGNVLSNLVIGDAALTAIMLACGNALEISLVIVAIRKFCGPQPDISEYRDLGVLVLAGVMIPPLCGLIAGFALAAPGSFFNPAAWWQWCAAHGLLIPILSPATLIMMGWWRDRRLPRVGEIFEWCVVSAAVILVATLIFAQSSFPLLFLAFPVVLLAAFRGGLPGAAMAVATFATFATVATYHNMGPIALVQGDMRARLIVLQLFLGSAFSVGIPVVAVLSNRERIRQELREAKNSAEKAVAAKSEFLANMSHEIRTPMNGVIGFTELLLAGNLASGQRDHVEMIAESGRTMMRLLNDILDMAKIEAGQVTIQREPVNVRHRIASSFRLMEGVAQAKGLQMLLTVEDKIPAWIEADLLRLRQVVLNLVANAVKFTSCGSIVVRVCTEEAEAGPLLCVHVTDTGIGIPSDQISNIFGHFAQADASTARQYGGTGLGLSISNQLAEMMGGTLTCESELGVGSTFSLRIPLLPSEGIVEQVNPLADRDAADSSDNIVGAHILVAEDHDINQALIKAMLTQIGSTFGIASNGLEAIEMVTDAKQNGVPYDLVLMDVQMPFMDGLAATRRLRQDGHDPKTLPVIALTANAYADDIADCQAAGMQGHLAKPVRSRDLAQAVSRWVPRKSSKSAVIEPEIDAGLEARFSARKADTAAAIAMALRQGKFDRDSFAELAKLLHKISGTAEYFGQASLGAKSDEWIHGLQLADAKTGKAILEEALKSLSA